MEVNSPNAPNFSNAERHTIRLPDDFHDTRHHLHLSRSRILDNLGRITHPSHRAMLERALEDIEKRLSRSR
jgi:hypothetical protein